ncbi:hypothetical protein F5141DRAFT_387172 [Pisolithus sp. B1]|nr:hypothetical protein F5141DRAFT_387172 [Pisolithus sp. B1]
MPGLTLRSGLPGATRAGDIDPSLIFRYTSQASLDVETGEGIRKMEREKSLLATEDFEHGDGKRWQVPLISGTSFVKRSLVPFVRSQATTTTAIGRPSLRKPRVPHYWYIYVRCRHYCVW